MRGKLYLDLAKENSFGITPAHAGKTLPAHLFVQFGRDHPRACGENGMVRVWTNVRSGSPPRMRGKLLRNRGDEQKFGITPAHAGKTRVRLPHRVLSWDHPRACGEND